MIDHSSSPAVRGDGHHGFDAVVLAGGAARRLGGADKPGVRVGGRALLDRVLASCADAGRTVVVADPRSTARPVRWAREFPPGGGPVAALAAGLEQTTADVVVVLSADLPFLDAATVHRLVHTLTASAASADGSASAAHVTGAAPAAGTAADAAGPVDAAVAVAATGAADARGVAGTAGRTDPSSGGTAAGTADSANRAGEADRAREAGTRGVVSSADGDAGCDAVLVVDGEGRRQPLVAAYRAEPLRRVLAAVAEENGGLSGLPLRRLTGALRVTLISDPAASFDCDTWDDIDTARARIREHEHVLDEWITAAKDELGIDLDVDKTLLLDLARDAAHGVARPAAPLTTFLVGYAAGRAGGGPEAVAEATRKAVALALRWADEAAAAKGTASDTASGTAPGSPSGTAPGTAADDATPADAG
ncbi:DUF6457 domain-containing protein [Streptomyces sp. NPDC056600]|uniref:DUF6457 domain-containing protein n=1 Tax=Streptomyces sp. NPDC056600 TaxID=3345874 RepID=UPI003679047A